MNRNMQQMPQKMDKKRCMINIYQLGFALNEAVLFLDTHPSDAEALNYYNDIKEKFNKVVDIYSDNFGPLLNSNVTSENYWMWVATPMPWELEGQCMWNYEKRLQFPVKINKTDPKLALMILSQYGGPLSTRI